MDKKSGRAKVHGTVWSDQGDRLSKMPAATAEQLNIAKILSKPGNDAELKNHVAQLQELTQCTEDQAVTALYDCENDIQRAVELLLDKFRAGVDEGWHTTGRKARTKHTSVNDSEIPSAAPTAEKRRDNGTGENPVDEPDKVEVAPVMPGRKERRFQKSVQKPVQVIAHDSKSEDNVPCDPQPCAMESGRDRKLRSKTFTNDGWDPYTEYGEWGGETIEIVNSNATYAKGLQEEALPEELFVETDNKIPLDTSDGVAPSTDASLRSINQGDSDSIFITKAVSKPPPRAFNNLPDSAVFLVPSLLPQRLSQRRFKFGGVYGPEATLTSTEANKLSQRVTAQNAEENLSCTATIHSNGEAVFPHKAASGNQPDSGCSLKVNGSRVTIENIHSSNKQNEVSSSFPASHLHSATVHQKQSDSFSGTQLGQSNATFGSDRVSAQTGFLESSLKNYIFDNLSSEMNKVGVTDAPQNTTSGSFNHPSVQTSQLSSNFLNNSVSSGSTLPQASGKVPLAHMTAHGPAHASQQPLVSSSHQQPATLPPGMPHFISQFSPAAYHMINLSGGSNNPPTLLDLEQLQLLQQQQRMLYDMQLQHQASTTSQGLLTSNSETASSKAISHGLQSSLAHATTTNAGVRPDILASAMGHTPQMIPPGNPYFPYASFVLMNGFTSPFMHQQQSGADGNQNPGTAHGGPSITQHQSQPNNPQQYSGLKQSNPAVSGYEELFDMKYGDPAKQVGFKSNPQYPNSFGSFQGHGAAVDGGKITGAHSAGGVLAPGFGMNAAPGGNTSHQQFSPQFYPSPATASPYFTAAAVAVAAAAAASAQQQHQASTSGNVSGNQSNSGASSGMSSVVGGGTQAGCNPSGPNNMHLSGNSNQGLLIGSSGSLHHHHSQRPVMSHQH